jgi:hypothetical protein
MVNLARKPSSGGGTLIGGDTDRVDYPTVFLTDEQVDDTVLWDAAA